MDQVVTKKRSRPSCLNSSPSSKSTATNSTVGPYRLVRFTSSQALCYLIVSSVLLLVLFNNEQLAQARIYRRSHKHLGVCRKEFLRPLEKRQLNSALVFTGTVERVYKQHSHPHHYRGIVRVKRVIKGLKQFQGNRVVVEGFGSQKICVADVKEQDTRIFLTNPISHGRLKLNSSLIRVNRKNVRKAVAAAKHSMALTKNQVANLRYFSNKLERLSRSRDNRDEDDGLSYPSSSSSSSLMSSLDETNRL